MDTTQSYEPTAQDWADLEALRRRQACEEIFAHYTDDPIGHVDRMLAKGSIDDVEFAATQVIDEGMALAGYAVLGPALCGDGWTARLRAA